MQLTEWWKMIPADVLGQQETKPQYIGNTGYGEDGKLQPSNPTHMINTAKGKALLDEGEDVYRNPDGSMKVIPASQAQETLKRLKEGGMRSYETGTANTGIVTRRSLSYNLPTGYDSIADAVTSTIKPIGAKPSNVESFDNPAALSPFVPPSNIGNVIGVDSNKSALYPSTSSDYTQQAFGANSAIESARKAAIQRGKALAATTAQTYGANAAIDAARNAAIAKEQYNDDMIRQKTEAASSAAAAAARQSAMAKSVAEQTDGSSTVIDKARQSAIDAARQSAMAKGLYESAEEQPPTPPQTDDYETGMEYLRGLVNGDSPYWRNIANRMMQQYGGASAAGAAAEKQAGAQMGLTPSQMATRGAVYARDTGVNLSELQGKLAETAMKESYNAANDLISNDEARQRLNVFIEQAQGTKKWDELIHAFSYGDDNVIREKYKEYFGTEITDDAMINDLRAFSRWQINHDMAMGEQAETMGNIAIETAQSSLGEQKFNAVKNMANSGSTYEDVKAAGYDISPASYYAMQAYYRHDMDMNEISRQAGEYGLTAADYQNQAAKLNLDVAVVDSIYDMANKGYKPDRINTTLGTNITEDEFNSIYDKTPMGQLDLGRKTTGAMLLLESDDLGDITEGVSLLNEIYDINLDPKDYVTAQKRENFTTGLESMEFYANSFNTYDEAVEAMIKDGTFENLGLDPNDPKDKGAIDNIWNGLRVNAVDEQWNMIETSETYLKASDEKKETMRQLYVAQLTGDLEFDIIDEYQVLDEAGNVVMTTAGIIDAENAIAEAKAGGKTWTSKATGNLKFMPKSMIGDSVTPAEAKPYQSTARSSVDVGDSYYVPETNKVYVKGEGDVSSDTVFTYTGEPGAEWDRSADFVLEQGKGTKYYDDIVRDRAEALISGDKEFNLSDFDKPGMQDVMDAIMNDTNTISFTLSSGETDNNNLVFSELVRIPKSGGYFRYGGELYYMKSRGWHKPPDGMEHYDIINIPQKVQVQDLRPNKAFQVRDVLSSENIAKAKEVAIANGMDPNNLIQISYNTDFSSNPDSALKSFLALNG